MASDSEDPIIVRRQRVLWAIAIGVFAAALQWTASTMAPGQVSDFDQLWFAARAVMSGRDPYALIGPGREFGWPWPLLYPLSGIIPIIPIAWMPVRAAGTAFAFFSGAVFGYAVAPFGKVGTFLVLSVPFAMAVMLGQWAPVLAAAALYPGAAFAAAVKPNIALSGLAGASWRAWGVALVSGIVLGAASFVLIPSWFGEWRAAISTVAYTRPYVLRPGGVLLLLALIRWREPQARILVAFAVIPMTPSIYDLLIPLTAIVAWAGTVRIAALLSLASLLLPVVVYGSPAGDFARWTERAAAAGLALVLWPCLVVVLARPKRGGDDQMIA
jgi:hypothetical protein